MSRTKKIKTEAPPVSELRTEIVALTSRDALAIEFAKALVTGYASGARSADVNAIVTQALAMADAFMAATGPEQ